MEIFKDRFLLFTDASFDQSSIKNNKTRVGNTVAGVVVVDTKRNNVDGVNLISIKNSTSNYGEMLAVKSALRMCKSLYEKTGETKFSILSDSQYTIYSLREWYLNWMKTDIMLAKDGELKNRALIESIIMEAVLLSQYGITIKLMHINGHTDTKNVDFTKTFILSNLISDKIDKNKKDKIKEELTALNKFNTFVDNITRNHLREFSNPVDSSILDLPIHMHPAGLQLAKRCLLSRYDITRDLI